jgi:hypothetical protein
MSPSPKIERRLARNAPGGAPATAPMASFASGLVAAARSERRRRVERIVGEYARRASSVAMPADDRRVRVPVRTNARSPPSRPSVSVPDKRGAAASDHFAAERDRRLERQRRAREPRERASGTALKLPDVVILPSSQAKSVEMHVAVRDVEAGRSTRMRVRATSTAAGAARRSVHGPDSRACRACPSTPARPS